MAACLLIMVCTLAVPPAALARQGVTAGAHVIFYGDNTEFRNPFREGETIFGAATRLDAQVELTPRVGLSLGVFGNQRFGSEDAFDLVRPILALTIQEDGRRSCSARCPPRGRGRRLGRTGRGPTACCPRCNGRRWLSNGPTKRDCSGRSRLRRSSTRRGWPGSG